MKWMEETPDGGFLNFLLFEDKPKISQQGEQTDDQIPF